MGETIQDRNGEYYYHRPWLRARLLCVHLDDRVSWPKVDSDSRVPDVGVVL